MVEHSGVDNYRGMEIKWAISEIDGSGLWRATAAIVTPPGAWSPPAVKSVPDIPERFNSEENAQESVSRLSRELVDGHSSHSVRLSALSLGSTLTNRSGTSLSSSESQKILMRAGVCLTLIAVLFLFAAFFDNSSSVRD